MLNFQNSTKVPCLVHLQVQKCFVPVQIFWASPKIWMHLVPLQKRFTECNLREEIKMMNVNQISVYHTLLESYNFTRFLTRKAKSQRNFLKRAGYYLVKIITGPVKIKNPKQRFLQALLVPNQPQAPSSKISPVLLSVKMRKKPRNQAFLQQPLPFRTVKIFHRSSLTRWTKNLTRWSNLSTAQTRTWMSHRWIASGK